MNVHCRVELGSEEREVLRDLIYRGSPRVRKVKRALILLGADEGRSHQEIARLVGVGTATVFRTKRDFVEYSPDLMPVERLWQWLRQQVTALHCHRDEDELRERLASFEAQLNDEPAQVHARLRPKTRLDPAEENLRV